LLKAITLINTLIISRCNCASSFREGKSRVPFEWRASSPQIKQMNAEMQSHRKILTNEVTILNPMGLHLQGVASYSLRTPGSSFEVINLEVLRS